jgi:membrane protease YdiL (CAAX protease family)
MNKEYKQLKPYQGIVVFVLSVFMLLFIAVPIQIKWGMYGVLLTEVFILLLGVLPAIVLKADLKEIFPVKKPKFRHILGVVVLWGSAYIAVLIISLIMGYFFPKGVSEVSNSLQDAFTSVPMGIAFLIIAVSPAICEEVLVRGFILSSLSSLKNKWIIVLSVGILFGIFHLDPFRFLPTAVLGMVLAYIMFETKNILLPALFHFINNGVSTLTSFATQTQVESTSIDFRVPVESIAVFLILGAGVPFLFILGAKLLQNKDQNLEKEDLQLRRKKSRRTMWIAMGCSITMAITGIVMFTAVSASLLVSSSKSGTVLEMTLTKDINEKTENIEIPFKVEKSGNYVVDFEIISKRGLIDMQILSEQGDEVYQTSCMWMTNHFELNLNQGIHNIILDFHLSDIEEYHREKGYNYSEKVKEDLNLTGDLNEYSPFEFSIQINKK